MTTTPDPTPSKLNQALALALVEQAKTLRDALGEDEYTRRVSAAMRIVRYHAAGKMAETADPDNLAIITVAIDLCGKTSNQTTTRTLLAAAVELLEVEEGDR